MLLFSELAKANLERCIESFHSLEHWSDTDWCCALAGEVGEACNLAKKIRRLDSNPKAARKDETDIDQLREKLGLELADVVIYADLIASSMGMHLEDLVRTKFAKTSERVGSDWRV